MATAMVSAARGVPVRSDVAMTGEITLSGLVLPVGGIREKTLAARRHGIRTIILPRAERARSRSSCRRKRGSDMTFHPGRHARAGAGHFAAGHRRQTRRRTASRRLGRERLTGRLAGSRLLHFRPRLRPRVAPDRNHQRARPAPAPTPRSSCAPSAPRWLFERTARVAAHVLPGECDTGVVQIDSLRLDEAADHRARRGDFYETLDATGARRSRAARTSTRCASSSPTRRRSALPRRPPPACRRLSCRTSPGTGSTRPTPTQLRRRAEAASRDPGRLSAGRAPRGGCRCTAASRPSIRSSTCRSSRGMRAMARDEVRRTLGAAARPAAGAVVVRRLRRRGPRRHRVSTASTRYGVVLTHRSGADRIPGAPDGIHQVIEEQLYGSGLRYEDLVAACDVVATKPGYGIIAECVANRTAILYTSRGRFVEYDVLVAGNAARPPLRLHRAPRSLRRTLAHRPGRDPDSAAATRIAAHQRSRNMRSHDRGGARAALRIDTSED